MPRTGTSSSNVWETRNGPHDSVYLETPDCSPCNTWRFRYQERAPKELPTDGGKRYLWIAPRALAGDDSLSRANRRTWEQDFKEHEGHAWIEWDGAILVRAIVTVPGIVEALDKLHDYPVMDDEALSEVEREDEDEAWESYARRDFASALGKRFGVDRDAIKETEDLRSLFTRAADRGNVNGGPGIVHESDGPYFMCEEVAEHVTMAECAALGLLDVTEALADLADDDTQEARDEARRLRRAEHAGAALRALADRLNLKTDDMLWDRTDEVDAGNEGAPLGADYLSNPTLYGLSIKLRRFVWTSGQPMEVRECTLQVDIRPAVSQPYRIDGAPVDYWNVRDVLVSRGILDPLKVQS